MGYGFIIANCGACGQQFTANPNSVPSMHHQGHHLVFCRECVEAANTIRRRNGMPEIIVLPDAYDVGEVS